MADVMAGLRVEKMVVYSAGTKVVCWGLMMVDEMADEMADEMVGNLAVRKVE